MSFEQWKARLDNLVAEELCGLTTDDLPDQMYWDMYDQGDSPEEVRDEIMGMIEMGSM